MQIAAAVSLILSMGALLYLLYQLRKVRQKTIPIGIIILVLCLVGVGFIFRKVSATDEPYTYVMLLATEVLTVFGAYSAAGDIPKAGAPADSVEAPCAITCGVLTIIAVGFVWLILPVFF